MRWANGQLQQVRLPDGVAVSDTGSPIYATPAGDLVFRGTCDGVFAAYCILKADGTVVRVDTGTMLSDLSRANNGYWLLHEPLGDSTTRVAATNGISQTQAVEIKTFLQNAERYEVRYVVDVAPDGAVLIFEFISTIDKSVSRLKFVGARNQVIVEKERANPSNVGEQLEVAAGVNELGDVLFSVTTYTPNQGGGVDGFQSLYIHPGSGGGGGKVLDQSNAFRSFDWPMQLANNQRAVYRAYNSSCDDDDRTNRAAAFSCYPYFSGFNLASDMVTIPFLDLFGVDGNLNGAPQLSPNGDFLMASVGLADGSAALVLAGATQRWANPDGGDWATAANWTPAGVPGGLGAAVFNLPDSYAVTLGTRQIGGVSVNKGNVTFRNGSLTVQPYNLAVADTADQTLLRLTIGGAGSSRSGADFSTTVNANIFVGPGELRVDNAELRAPGTAEQPGFAELGALGPATVTVTGGAVWRWQQMKVGAGFPTTLRLEDGAFVGDFPAAEMIIGGSGSGLAQNHVARVSVDNAANNPGPLGLGTALSSILNLAVGQELMGELHVTNGGSVFAITATVGALDHGSRTDGVLTVTGGNVTRPSTFAVGNDFANNGVLFAATGQGTDAQIEITEGGRVQVTSLSLASGPQSNALAFVDGVSGQRRSSLTSPLPGSNDVGAPNPAAGMCVVGHAGQAALNVSNGGLMECRNIAVGLLPGSRGEINIGADGSQVIARGTINGDGLVCIGGVLACGGPGAGARGDVIIAKGGLLEGEMVLVGTRGRIRGNGTILALDGVHLFGGSVSPGITILEPQARSVASHTPGTLTIEGNLLISPTSAITMNVLGGTADLQDRLVVSGTLNLNGDLAINFGNGYAPRQGDSLALIQASAITGAPQEVRIDGLKPGFDYELVVVAGALTLTALNDGESTTQNAVKSLYLPLIQRPAW